MLVPRRNRSVVRIATTTAEEDFQLVTDRKWPQYSTYRGPAKLFTTDWYSLGSIVIDMDQFITLLMESIVAVVNGVIPLHTLVYRRSEVIGIIPYYHYKLQIYAVLPSPSQTLKPYDAGVGTVLALIIVALIAYAAIQITQNVKDVVWGPPGTSDWTRWLLPAAIVLIAGGYAFSKFKG